MSNKINEKPHNNIPRPEDINRDTLVADIEKKKKLALEQKNIRTFTNMGNPITFPVIEIERSRLLYNLENDRTMTKCEEYEVDNNCKDFFDRKNFWNVKSQQAYHQIIHDFIPTEMADALYASKYQRDEIFITYDGVVANGNTRLACMREFIDQQVDDAYITIKCCVIDQDKGADWSWIRRLVDSMDNQIDFSAPYPWYSRARRFEKNCLDKNLKNILLPEDDGGPAMSELKKISDGMQYKNPGVAIERFGMLELAREFVNAGLLSGKENPKGKYSKLSELSALGAQSGKQVFETLYRGNLKVSNDSVLQNSLKNIAFGAIATGANSHDEDYKTNSLHTLVAKLYKDNAIKEFEKKYGSAKQASDKFKKSKENKNKASKKSNVFVFSNKNSVPDIKKDISSDLKAATLSAARDAGENIQKRYLATLEKCKKTLTDAYVEQLKDDSLLDGTQSILEDIKREADKHIKQIDSILDKQN